MSNIISKLQYICNYHTGLSATIGTTISADLELDLDDISEEEMLIETHINEVDTAVDSATNDLVWFASSVDKLEVLQEELNKEIKRRQEQS